MENFKKALVVLLKHEGGDVDHANDPGGVTRKGISLRFLRAMGHDINGDGEITRLDVLALTDDRISYIYYRDFWLPNECGSMPFCIALAVFDSAVNQGVGTAAKILQRSVRVKADADIGPITIQAIQSADPTKLIKEFTARRCLRYAINPVIHVFGLGWYRRAIGVCSRALSEA